MDLSGASNQLWPYKNLMEGLPLKMHLLKNIMSKGKREFNERQTELKLILPILYQCLDFPAGEIDANWTYPLKIDDYNYYPDLAYSPYLIIESKAAKERVLHRSHGRFDTPVDQGLTYSELARAKCCIVTNGWEWLLIRPNELHVPFGGLGADLVPSSEVYAVRTLLDRATEDSFRDFIGLFHADSITGKANANYEISQWKRVSVKRKELSGEINSSMFLHDFGPGPFSGKGSGFQYRL